MNLYFLSRKKDTMEKAMKLQIHSQNMKEKAYKPFAEMESHLLLT